MNRKLFSLLVLLFVAVFSFAQEADFENEDFLETEFLEEDYEDDYEEDSGESEVEVTSLIEVPSSILNNQYYLQSVRLNNQAKEAFEEGDYDASAYYAEQAAEYARLSDEYVEMRLAQYAYAKAHSRYTWAGSVGAATRYPSQYRTATTAYDEATEARQAESWYNVTEASNRVLIALNGVTGTGGDTGPAGAALPPRPVQGAPKPPPGTLPAQYTVRRWNSTGDCFSTIAGWDWVYGDATQWRKLYDANKNKIPDPNNPHLILPGMILDIPSVHGETRSGMWDPAAKY